MFSYLYSYITCGCHKLVASMRVVSSLLGDGEAQRLMYCIWRIYLYLGSESQEQKKARMDKKLE